MLGSQKIALKQSERRERLGVISQMKDDDVTDEIRSEVRKLEAKLTTGEIKYRAALQSEEEGKRERREHTPDSEARERLGLRGKAKLADWIASAFDGRAPDGASAEFAAACGASASQVPVDLFEEGREVRAITPAQDATNTSTAPTVPAIFERSDAASLGVAMPMVPPGQRNIPVLTTAPPAGAVAKDGSASATAGAFTLATRDPKRIAGQFEIRVEDIATMPSIEDDLRRGLSGAMADALDEQVIGGNGTSPNLSGLFNVASNATAEGTKATFATGLALYAALVDGKHAYGWEHLHGLIGTDTFALFASLFQSNGDVSLYDYLRGKMASLRVSGRCSAKNNSDANQKAIVTLTAGRQPITVPVWSAMDIIVDPYSGAGAGKRVVTMTALVSDPHVPYSTAMVKELNPKIT